MAQDPPGIADRRGGVWRAEGCSVLANWLSPKIVEVWWRGNISLDVVEEYLPPLHKMVDEAPGKVSLLYHLLHLDNFQLGVLPRHARFAAQNHSKLHKIAIITTRPAHRLAVSTINTMQPFRLQAFESIASARGWIDEKETR